MGLQYITASEDDFSLGIDARSAENQIAPGFVQDLLNADIIEKRARKRAGYQGYAGNVPIRVNTLQYIDATNQICFDLDGSIDLGSQRSTPIVVYGRSSTITSGGPFTTAGDAVRYYSGFTVPTKKTMLATAGAPPFEDIDVPESEHGIDDTSIFVGVAESTSTIDRSYQTALPHTVDVDVSAFDLSIAYQNSTGADKDVFVYYLDRQLVVGETYIATLSHTGSGSETFSIPPGTHGLTNFNIIAQIQQDLTSTYQYVAPEALTVEQDGDVVITLNSDTATDYYAILSIAPIEQQITGNIQANSSESITITGLTSPWLFYGIYLETMGGGDRELTYADTIAYDDSTGSATLTFTNSTNAAKSFAINYIYGSTRSNQLCVTDTSVTTDATDVRPQMTLWGLDHTNLYGDSAGSRAGWVNHIDSYRSSGEQRLVAGLGGNLFTAKSYSEAAVSYKYATLLPNVRARTSSAVNIGPLFYDTGDAPARTRGYITADDSGTNWATITAVSYDTNNGYTKYHISLPNKQILDVNGSPTSLASVISTTAGLEDWLTVNDMGYARFNGTYRICQIADGADSIDVWVDNQNVDSSDFDDANCLGEAAVFTDQITWLADSPFIPGDLLASSAFNDSFISTVLSSLDAVSVVDGLTDSLSIAAGLTTTASRTSDTIPLRSIQPNSVASVTNLVVGDMLSYSTTVDDSWDERLLRVLYVNSDQDRSIDIVGDGATATATMATGDISHLVVGQNILLTNAGEYTGAVTITDLPAEDSFQFSSTSTDTVTGATLLGKTAQLDESFNWADVPNDTTGFLVDYRWIPIEAPDDSYNQTPSCYIDYFATGGYDEQSFLRSTMVQNNMYLTNYLDEVFKFDGINSYRAGLFPWQPGLFLTQDTAASAKIVADNPTATPSAFANGIFTLSLGDEFKFSPGSRLRHSYTGGFDDYTVVSTYDNGTNGFVKIARTKTSTLGAAPAITLLSARRYYFRLNAIDANNNIIASAVTGYQDHVAEFAADSAINIKGVGLPAGWGVYDYDRLEVEIYGTKLNTVAPFYRISTVQMDFDLTEGYFNYTDSFADSDLIDLDVVNTALKGAELGISWQEPLRAKYVTSLGNSLVLGNVKDYPQLDLQLIATGAVLNATYADKIFLFRKDNTDSASTTLMPDRARYQLVDTGGSVTISAATGTANTSFLVTVTNTAVAGDWVYLFWSSVATSGRPLTYAGWWQIASATGTDITINYTGSGSGDITALVPDEALFATDPTDIPVPLGTDGNMGMVNGDSFDLFDVGRRLSMAINASMRMVDTSITGMGEFTPWMSSRGGNDVGRAGRVIIRQPKVLSTTLELVLPSSFSGSGQSFQVFVNDIRRATSEQISAITRLYPSRILVSYENYPEIFDSPTSVLDTESDSAIDINSADGQEITGILPFFGEAAFGAAQQSAILVVFKTNSIYLVDVNEKRAGRNAVQRIETEGLGCTAPYSIAVTKNGIIFANESGIYCLRRSQAIDYIGRYMERNWTERVDLDQLSIAQGHHYGVGRSYKLSVPLIGAANNSEVYVYNHTGESFTDGNRQGAWGRYDNHPATGWANLAADAFFGTVLGRVFSIRNKGTQTDFRDDNAAINMQLDTRPLDFGNNDIRKVLDKAVINYRTDVRSEGTSVYFSTETEQEYQPSTELIIPKRTSSNGIDDTPNRSIYQIASETSRRRAVYHQVRVTNDAIDEGPEVAGIGFRVGGLQTKGIVQAKETQSK